MPKVPSEAMPLTPTGPMPTATELAMSTAMLAHEGQLVPSDYERALAHQLFKFGSSKALPAAVTRLRQGEQAKSISDAVRKPMNFDFPIRKEK